MEENVEVKKEILSQDEKVMIRKLALMVVGGIAMAIVVDLLICGLIWRVGTLRGMWMRAHDLEAWRSAALKFLES